MCLFALVNAKQGQKSKTWLNTQKLCQNSEMSKAKYFVFEVN